MALCTERRLGFIAVGASTRRTVSSEGRRSGRSEAYPCCDGSRERSD